MKIPCEYCGQMIPETAQKCSYCGAGNRRVRRTAYGVPATIEELRAYCRHHNLPLADMRVFLGEDDRGAKAFGIYRDENTGNFVVYKNKADGTRAVRYEGSDEAYAVNELYLKIRERVAEQKRHLPPRRKKVLLMRAAFPARAVQTQENIYRSLFCSALLLGTIRQASETIRQGCKISKG